MTDYINFEDLTDEEIVFRIKHGNKEDFEILMNRYADKLRRYAKKFFLDKTDSDDLLQDIFIKTYENLESFDNTRKFSPWIYRIAHNEFINKVKKKLREKLISIDFDTFFPHPEAKEKSDESMSFLLDKKIIEKHLNELDIKYREVLILFFYEEMDYKDISEVLSIPISTVGVRLNRAKEKIKLLLKDKNI